MFDGIPGIAQEEYIDKKSPVKDTGILKEYLPLHR